MNEKDEEKTKPEDIKTQENKESTNLSVLYSPHKRNSS